MTMAPNNKSSCSSCRSVTQPDYISSACASIVVSWPPFRVTCTAAETFPDWLPSWVIPSDAAFSGMSTGSWRTAAPSGGPDWLRSGGGGEESEWTVGLPAPSAVSCEDAGSVRMFLEITTEIKSEDFFFCCGSGLINFCFKCQH